MIPMQVADKGRLLAVSILVLAFVVDGAYSSGCGDAEVCAGLEGVLSPDVPQGSLVQTRSHSMKTFVEVNASRKGQCMPPYRPYLDPGKVDDFRGWYDVQGCGRCNDYCRWVGGPVSGGDPRQMANWQGRAFWSCRLAGRKWPDRAYTPKNTYTTWKFPKCAGQGAMEPQQATPYVPGEQGGAWTVDEMDMVRAKIHRVITEGDKVIRELTGDHTIRNVLSNPAATILRLGFHDCLKYADGTGGCDGCLEWKGVGHLFTDAQLRRGLIPADAGGDGHNNGLQYITQVLEGIYTQADFPRRTPWMALSPQQSGKSRADLWAFATLVATQYALDLNNEVCANPETHRHWPWGQCHPREGEDDCTITAPRALIFKTGRRDCIGVKAKDDDPPYATTKEESHPNPEGNGSMTVGFFKKDFNFNGRETVAIMGAHTLGKLNPYESLFRYTWKTNSGKLLNNGYYRNMARKHDWYFPSDHGKVPCKHVGDNLGRRPEARWMPHVRGDKTTGGPVQWLQEKKVCRRWNKTNFAVDTCAEEDLIWRFVNGIDETMLPCEIGLFIDFPVDENFIPYGCKGFEMFNMEHWGGWDPNTGFIKKWWNRWTKIGGRRVEPLCGPQRLAEPEGDTPLHQIVEHFADRSENWLEVFFPTMEKMLANGYQDGELHEAPAEGMSGFSCTRQTPDGIRHGRTSYECTRS